MAVIAVSYASAGDLQASSLLWSKGTWLGLSFGDAAVYYDPYLTKRNKDGTVETVIAGTNLKTGKPITATLAKINCHENTLQYSDIKANGGWELSKDWHPAKAASAEDQWAKRLCGIDNESLGKLEFLYLSKGQGDIPSSQEFYLTRTNPASTNKNVKTLALDAYNLTTKNWTRYEVHLNCKEEKIAYGDGDWKNLASPKTAAGYMFYRSCGFQPKATPPKPGQNHAKCEELGFTQGTQEFDNCVRRLGT